MVKQKVTFKGGPLTLIGPELKVGDAAPQFALTSPQMQEVTLDQFQNKILLLSVVPSLDTSVCDQQTRRFNEEIKKLPKDVAVICISADLPFAQDRWRRESKCIEIETLSDYKEKAFGKAYGVLIDELKLLSRSIFIIGKDRKIAYIEIVPEITTHPNYEAALKQISVLQHPS